MATLHAEVKMTSGAGTLNFSGGEGPGKGKHVVLLAGDEEYRSEEVMPIIAKMLAEKHGFETTVLFSADEDGTINPTATGSLMGAEALDKADALVMLIRFRNWNDETMGKFKAAIDRGVPVVAMRTSTHAFNTGKGGKWGICHGIIQLVALVAGCLVKHGSATGVCTKRGDQNRRRAGERKNAVLKGVGEILEIQTSTKPRLQLMRRFCSVVLFSRE